MKFRSSSKKAYILMEVMLASGIFAVAGIGLALALNDIAKASLQCRKFNAIRIELASRLAEARLLPLFPLKNEIKNPDGVLFTEIVTPLETKNRDQVQLPGLYRLRVTAEWLEGKVPQKEQSEVYVYQP